MKDISVRDIVNETSGKLLQGPEDLLLTSVTTDSRMVGENALFVGISGETMDGNRFAASAVENGAKAAMISDARVYEAYRKDHPEDRDTAFILVDNTTDAIQRTARMARRRIPVPAVGVTGSVGKTTTREMIACAFGLRHSKSSSTRGKPWVISSEDATPPVWNVRIVSWVPGSPMDCAAMTPTASPILTGLPLAIFLP